MAKYYYTAKNLKTGESMGGAMDAKSREFLAKNLRSQGYILTSVQEEEIEKKITQKTLSLFQGGSVPLKEKMVFARNLGVMISSGLPLAQAVEALKEQSKNKMFRKVMGELVESIRTGNTLADSLAQYPKIFNELFVNMVRVGEVSGSLEEVLDIVATQLEKDHALISKVRGAMIYPAVILFAMFGIAILMLTYILPQILGVFKDMEVELPQSTQMIIKVSELLRNHSILVSIFSVIFLFGASTFFKTPSGKRVWSWIVLHIPVVNNIVIKVNCARFARIYASLLKSGVGVVEALGIIERTLFNVYYQEALVKGKEEVQKGVELSKIILLYNTIFPSLVYQMFRVGEQTGKSEEVLLKLALFYEDEVDQITKNLSSIIEPILMLLIGGGVGFFAVAMLQPMYSVLNNI